MKKLILALCAIVGFFAVGTAQVVNVADYGIKPGKDVTLEVNQLIESLKGKDNVTLFFPKGQYEFYPENAIEMYRAVTNHDNSLKRIAFPIFNFKNFTLDGNGSTFMFHGKLCPIIVESSVGTTLKNFTIDWEISFVNEMKVIKTNKEENSFIVEVNYGKSGFEVKKNQILFNHYNWQDPIGQNIAFDPATKSPIWSTRDYALRGKANAKVEKLNSKTAKFTNYTKKVPPVGTILATCGLSPDGNRFVQAIHLSNSKDNVVENTTILAAGGMAIIAERCENVYLNKFVVTSRDDRMISTRADATHFLGCKGEVRLENCLLQHMLDDGINVHGAYVKVVDYIGDNQFICETSHVQQLGFLFAEDGDEVMLMSRETVLPIFKTKVKKAKYLNENRILLTVADMPSVMPTGLLSFENLTWYPDLYVNNNTINENRARSALITTKGKVVVENNFFSSQMHGILIEGDNKKWYESGGVEDVIIRNNTFVNIGQGDGKSYPLYASPMLTPEQRLGDDKFHRNITFSNNTIKSFNGHLVYAKSVKGLYVEGNTIVLDKTYPSGSKLPAVDLIYCEDVVLKKNKFKGFSWPIKIEEEKTKNVKVSRNRGLKK